ncbi:MAG: hypothetical protein A2235_08585, partial [Deltaproteobacteria bacterium RIFOXYA2_FULL_42_10]
IMNWNDTLETGIAWQDSQHKEFFSKFADMVEDMKAGGGTEAVDRLLKFLSTYTTTHFSDEERCMEKFNYEGYFVHRREHREFKSILSYLKWQFETQDTHMILIARLYNLLWDWLRYHMGESDKTLGEFLKDKAI